MTTARECAWTARSEASWLSLTGSTSGQGDGAVEYRAVANPDPVVRRGAVVLNDARAELTQAAGQCAFSLREASASFTPAGGNGAVGLQASSAMCSWSANADASWITITSSLTGQGSATIAFQVLPTTGPPRTATITVAGQRFSVTQSEGCSYSISPEAQAFGASGGSGTVAVSAAPGCPWTAASNVDWIAVTDGESGTGPGTVLFSVPAWTGSARSGTLTVAGQSFRVSQSQNCTYAIAPESHAVGASGGTGQVLVTTSDGCPWTATSPASWISITEGAAGAGSGTVGFAVAASTGAPRTAVLTIAGRPFTVTQADGCVITLAPERVTLAASAATTSFAVQTASGCSWSASSTVPWITVTSGRTGSGNGTVALAVSANAGAARTGAVAVGGRTFTVEQQSACSYALSETTRQVPAGGGTGTVSVTANAGCAWTAASEEPWITVTSGATGSGNGTVAFSVAPNTGGARSGAITIAGLTFTIQQAASCSFSVAPREEDVGSGGGAVAVAVTASASSCAWTAASSAPWITVTAGATGTGNGSAQLTVAANGGPSRTGTATVAGQSVVIRQASGCSYTLSPQSRGASPNGTTNSFSVATAEGCTWKAVSQVPWIAILSGGSGAGSGTVQYGVAPNETGQTRTGTITVEDAAFTVTQSSGGGF